MDKNYAIKSMFDTKISPKIKLVSKKRLYTSHFAQCLIT